MKNTMTWQIDKRINLATITAIVVLIASVVIAFTQLQSGLQQFGYELEQERMQRERIDNRTRDIQASLRHDYMTREQIDYVVIQRIDRMERIMNKNFNEIKESMERNGLRQDNIQRRELQPRQQNE